MQSFFRRSVLPIIPREILARFHVQVPRDTRFASSARLLQSIWREHRGFAPGAYVDDFGEIRKLGSLIADEAGRAGANFLGPEIAHLVRRDTAYREFGAMIDERRLWTNLLSSHPLTYNLFGPLLLDLTLATKFFRLILPDFVGEVIELAFEHSPGRGEAAFTGDRTAFDVVAAVRTLDAKLGYVAIELKYSESMMSAPRIDSARYSELAAQSRLYRDPAASELRVAPLQQLLREHLLSQAMVASNPEFEEGRFIVIYPSQNRSVDRAVALYKKHLAATAALPFATVTLEHCVAALSNAGSKARAAALNERYLDFSPIEQMITEWARVG